MRIIKTAETTHTCQRCKSTIGILPHEISTVGPLGPYDMDDGVDVGKQYWSCPVCKNTNYIKPPSDHDDY